MKKRHTNIALITLMVVIWGGVFYKLFGKKKAETGKLPLVNSLLANVEELPIHKDTFDLVLSNRDPFNAAKIEYRPKKAVSNQTKPNSRVGAVKPKKESITWPSISYHGFVKHNGKTTRLVLLKVNNKLYRKRENDEVDDLKIVKAYSDSLIVSINNNRKTIKK